MKTLVTGAAGYIGSVVSELLLAAGHDVVGLDDFSKGHGAAVVPGTTIVRGALGDTDGIRKVVRDHQPDAVIHLAAKSIVPESVTDPGLYYRVNVTQSLGLLDAMVEYGVDKFVFSSSAAVYGEPETLPITEGQIPRPVNPYGETKRVFEEALRWYRGAHSLKYVALRYFNAAGATERFGEDHQPESHLIPNLLRVALGQTPSVTIFGDDYPTRDGTCVRDYVHVMDIADAHIRALEKLDDIGGAMYNIGTGSGASNLEVLETVRQVTGHAIPMEMTARRPGDPPTLVAGNDKVSAELGWTGAHSALEETISSAWGWMQRFPNGYLRQ